MDVLEAIRTRKSIRAFKPDPVPRETLRQILEISLRAQSWANTQPWEFAVVGGEVLAEIKRRFLAKSQAGEPMNPDIPHPSEFPPVNQARRRELGITLLNSMGIARDDRERRKWWAEEMLRFFGAPNAVFFYLDERFGPYGMLDIGALTQTIMLAALEFGLGGCAMAAAVHYPDVLREVLGVPKSKKFVCGVAIGYPDREAANYKIVRNRAPLDEVSTWHGF